MLKEAAGTVSQHVQFGYIFLGVPSGRSKYFDIRFTRGLSKPPWQKDELLTVHKAGRLHI
jgi:hypothetical protein